MAGIGQALQQHPQFRYILSRNEQAMVHTAAAFAKASWRLRTYACTTSIGPGATNMVTGAACATINRLPVLLLPGDIFASRRVAPVLQQLESSHSPDISVNDCFKPVSRYWDRISRPEQLITSLPEAMRTLVSPSDTGAVTLCLPQDVQAEAFECPAQFVEPRLWDIPRNRPDTGLLQRARAILKASRRPLIVAGGGVLYSEASEALRRFVEATGIPVAETQAGKGSLPFDQAQCVGAIGVTGTTAANQLAAQADVVIGIGTRYSDFTTASHTLFAQPDVQFININVAEFDAFKHAATALVGDARATLEEWGTDFRISDEYRTQIRAARAEWEQTVDRFTTAAGEALSQAEVIAAVNRISPPAIPCWAPPAVCRAICTSCGGPALRAATIWNTATPPWATKSPAGWASNWPDRKTTCT